MKEIILSIIVPVYNTEKYLYQCLESISKQNYAKENYEVIIINDGSTDNSSNIINEFSSKFPNFLLIDRQNKGLLFSRMEGVRKAKGKYILFLDSDDYLLEGCLEVYNREIQKGEYNFIKGNYCILVNNTEKVYRKRFENCVEINDKKILYEWLLTTDKYNSVWGQIIKKSSINISAIDTSISMGEDVEINQNSYLNIKCVKVIDDFVYCYRENPTSMTKSYSIEKIKKYLIDLDKVYTRLIRNVKLLNDNKLTKLSYCKYLFKMNTYNYRLIYNTNDSKDIEEFINISFNSNSTKEARAVLKYKEIIPKNRRLPIYLILKNNKKIYFFLLRSRYKIANFKRRFFNLKK